VGFTLIGQCLVHIVSTTLSPLNWVIVVAVLIAAACLLLGFITPVVAIVIGLAALTQQFLDPGQTLVNIVVLAAAIALLGPGAFSIDARMFGRREILISTPTRSPKS
jgi:uncharacterized membrane protein YphA (DoxX/SURF4 family)